MDITATIAREAQEELRHRLRHHLLAIYGMPDHQPQSDELVEQMIAIMRLGEVTALPEQHHNLWDQSDAILITYGDSIIDGNEKPLKTLQRFLAERVKDRISGVHILPFYPFSSDDGFSVMDYHTVNKPLGDWSDIRRIAGDYRLMADLVINHCSSRSVWFENFLADVDPGRDYFFTTEPDADLSQVVRPRTNPLLREVETAAGLKHVWCTFSHDQVDLDFRNLEVLKEFLKIIRLYLDQGVRIFRLDAIAFLWKEPGTSSLNMPQTHEAVRLLRTLVEFAQPDAMLITETNIPNQENLSYFGNANEAHSVYNFSLPPLLVNTLITGDCGYLKQWMMSMPPAQAGTAFFNFIASHDGIGLRPAEGLLTTREIDTLVATMEGFGGRISWRNLEGGGSKPYEINISLFDALQGTVSGPDTLGPARFLCAHTIMLGLEGIPGIYIHSLIGTRNDYERLQNTGQNRAINRHQWPWDALSGELDQPDSPHARVFDRILQLLDIRRRQPAFHPNATQFTLHLGNEIFGYWRQSINRSQSIFCISNISRHTQSVPLTGINLIESETWTDLLSGTRFIDRTELLELQPYQTVWISNRD